MAVSKEEDKVKNVLFQETDINNTPRPNSPNEQLGLGLPIQPERNDPERDESIINKHKNSRTQADKGKECPPGSLSEECWPEDNDELTKKSPCLPGSLMPDCWPENDDHQGKEQPTNSLEQTNCCSNVCVEAKH